VGGDGVAVFTRFTAGDVVLEPFKTASFWL
jgi:hypothetical protein